MNLKRYSKTIAAAAGTIGGIVSFLADGEVSQNDIFGIVSMVLGALGVYQVPNAPMPPQH